MSTAPFRALVTGSRTWRDTTLVAGVLEGLRADHPGLVIVHGHAKRGADAIADLWCAQHGVTAERHPAEWERYGAWRAGLMRNQQMVASSPDACVAFLMPCRLSGCRHPQPHPTHGAGHCATIAEEAGVPTRRYYSKGFAP